jgi:hypothetical protein
VTRPGGRIIMGNWIPNDPTLVAQILKISSSYSPPPPEGFISPMTWGIENNVIERFAGAGVPKEKISFVRDTYTFNFPGPPSELVDAFKKYYGPTMSAFEAAEKNGRAGDLQKELQILFNSQNKSPRKDATSIPATFLRVTVALDYKPSPRHNQIACVVRRDVCLWHFSDIPPALTNVRYWGQSRHDANGPLCRLMTQSGHCNCHVLMAATKRRHVLRSEERPAPGSARSAADDV